MPAGPIDLLLVASWYPSIVDPAAGRFVADQAAALAASARARPSVVSFEPAELLGASALRTRMAETVRRATTRAIVTAPAVFSATGWGSPPGVPVARLPIPNGRTNREPVLHALRHREAVLGALADRWRSASGGSASGRSASGGSAWPPLPAIVHAHTGYPDGAAAAGLARRFGVPLVVTEHASFLDRLFGQPEVRRAYLETVQEAARLIVVSETLASEIRARLPDVVSKMTVIPNAIAVDDFQSRPLAERRAEELLFVGYLREAKGIELLLTAVARTRTSRPGVTLRLVGAAPDKATDLRWRSMAGQLGIADAVSFEPPTDRAGVAAAMARASLLVHPSQRETFGIVAAEALASGTPVVATDSGGVTEILADDPDELGAIVPRDDAEALAQAIERALERRSAFDPDRMRASVVRRFGAPAVADRLIRVYEEALGGPRPPVATAGPARTDAGVATPSGRPAGRTVRVVVAFDPDRAAVVDRLPPATQAGLVLVTSTGSTVAHLEAGRAATIVGDLQGRVRAMADAAAIGPRATGLRRILRALRHPLAVARRRGLLPGLERLLTTRGSEAVRVGLARARTIAGPDAPIEVICIDAIDFVAAGPALAAAEAILAPGGIRWLGDQSISGAGVQPSG